MIQWFGVNWGAVICKDSPRVSTPVGTLCRHCEEPIVEGDFGVIMPHMNITRPDETSAFHYECNMRTAIGSVGHQMRECSCYGHEDRSEIGISKREAARRAARFFENFVKRSI